MNRLDRALGILLLLSQGRTWPAQRLSERFEVSVRTIYRDVEALQALGVPVVATRGAGGGFHLMEGFVLPPVNLTRQEAVSLVLGVAILRTLRTLPFAEELDTAEGKLLSALPGQVRAVLSRARELIGFEPVAEDTFHRERPPVEATIESEAVDGFLRAIVDMTTLRIGYASPYRPAPERLDVVPLGLLWDRDRWYLVARVAGDAPTADATSGGRTSGGRTSGDGPFAHGERLFRADRVTGLEPLKRLEASPDFDVRALLGRGWLGAAMRRWVEGSTQPVRIRITPEQAARLRRDWYYQHALYEEDEGREAAGEGAGLTLRFADSDRQGVFDLVRWLGPGAELLEPATWRDALRRELEALARVYA